MRSIRAHHSTLYALILLVSQLACRSGERISADHAPVDASIDTNERFDAAEEASVDATPEIEAPTRTASRARFASIPLNAADHGIDGTFELWRDARLDDKATGEMWFHAVLEPFADNEVPPEFVKQKAVSAQLIVRETKGKVVESLDLVEPLARLSTVRLGDDVVPYVEVEVDTYKGVGRWGGTSTRFVRVEHGHSSWLPCEVYSCALGCAFDYDRRPSGGNDLLVARHGYDGTTSYTRIQIASGKCSSSKRVVKGWVGEPVTVPGSSSFPPR